MSSLLAEHLIRQINHFDIGFDTDFFSERRQIVKEVGKAPFKKYRYNIPLTFDGVFDKTVFPLGVADLSCDATGTEPCREGRDLVVAGQCIPEKA